MPAIWFAILGSMLTAYAVLDGFDFGAGIVHLFVARDDDERHRVLAAIGPLWDGNEVWLIASGGVFVFAFPRAYAAAFSGLYLPLMIVLWLLILRGISIEFRSAVANPLWRSGWDVVFAFASAVMALVLGVALGNVVRGVPLGKDGTFHEDLFAGFGSGPGAIDLFTGLYGLFAFAALGAHGATFIAWKTDGPLCQRSRDIARTFWMATFALGVAVTICTGTCRPALFARVSERAFRWPLPLGTAATAILTYRSLASGRDLSAFLGSCGFIASLLLAAAGALYPTLLLSTIDNAFTLDAYNTASAPSALTIGLAVTLPALALAVSYFAYLFYAFRGKVKAPSLHDGEPHH